MLRRTMLSSVLAVLFAARLAAQTDTTPKPADPVNVVNTPSVNVVNTPTVQLAGTSTVQVSGTTNVKVQNDSSTPVPVQDVSQPKRTPFQASQNFGPTPFASNNPASRSITVPAGKRLVIEHVSARAHVPFGTSFQNPLVLFSISTTVAGVSVQHFLEVPKVFAFHCQSCAIVNQEHDAISQEVRFYSDGGTTVQLTALGTETGTGGIQLQFIDVDIDFAISGYLEDAP